MTNPIIAFYSAFDRFNFGDLLFPVVARHYAPKVLIEKADWHFYGLVDSELQDRGGSKVTAIKHLIDGKPMPDGSMVIVPGGEVLTASIKGLYQCLFTDLYKSNKTLLCHIKGIIGKRDDAEKLAMKQAMNRLGVPWVYPFVPQSNWIPGSPLTAFIGVGGQKLPKIRSDRRQKIYSALSGVEYLSVREPLTQNMLVQSGLPRCKLAPDPVHTIRRIHSKNEVALLASQATQLIINSHREAGYFCFQSALRHLKGKSEMVASQLDKISEESGLVPVLVAAGTARGHEDHIGLYSVSIKMKKPHVFVPMPSVMDIVALIACSRLGISTSLHAMIIAISYEVPRLVLSGLESKTSNYSQHWDNSNYVSGVGYENMISPALRALQSDPNQMYNLAETLASEAEDSIKAMWGVMLSSAKFRTSFFN